MTGRRDFEQANGASFGATSDAANARARMREMMVTACDTVGRNLHVLSVVGGHAPSFEPGQFVHMLPLKHGAPLLPRPLSILRWEDERLDVLFKVVGRGTSSLLSLSDGAPVRVLGPLGTGFQPPEGVSAIVIGGGVGIAPLVPLVQRLSRTGVPTACIYGAATREGLAMRRVLAATGVAVHVATEDGSLGYCGDVVDLLKQLEPTLAPDDRGLWIAACGPWEMMRRLSQISEEWGGAMEVSLESRMACGVGACLGCAVARADEAGYSYVCTDGPVFDAGAIDWRRPPL